MEINDRHYPFWSQFVEKKDQFTGGVLQDFDGGDFQTKIRDVRLTLNGDNSAFFEVVGEDFSCGFDVQFGGVTTGDPGWITFSGYGGHIWRIKMRGDVTSIGIPG